MVTLGLRLPQQYGKSYRFPERVRGISSDIENATYYSSSADHVDCQSSGKM